MHLEQILDLACGTVRHALEAARRGKLGNWGAALTAILIGTLNQQPDVGDIIPP